MGKAFNGRIVSVRRDQSSEGFHEVPGRAIKPRFVAGVDIFARSTPPALAARDQLEFNHTLGAEGHSDLAIQLLLSRGHEDSASALHRSQHPRSPHALA